MTDRHERLSELAYFLWREEGCPEGEAERHWLTAEALLDAAEPAERKHTEGEPPGDSGEKLQIDSGISDAGVASQLFRRRGAPSGGDR